MVSAFFPLKGYLGEFLPIRLEGLGVEGVGCGTDCELLSGKFVILGFKNKIDVTRLGLSTFHKLHCK